MGGEIFRTCPHRPWGPPRLLYNKHRVSFPGVKRPGRSVDHPPPSSAEVKERVEVHLYSPSGPSWPVLGQTLLHFLTLGYGYERVVGHVEGKVMECFKIIPTNSRGGGGKITMKPKHRTYGNKLNIFNALFADPQLH